MKYKLTAEEFWTDESNRKKYSAVFKRYKLSKRVGKDTAEFLIKRDLKNHKLKIGRVDENEREYGINIKGIC